MSVHPKTQQTVQAGADLILHNGRIAIMDAHGSFVSSVAIKDGRILEVGSDKETMKHANNTTQVIDLGNRTAIPGLIDSHIHLINGGLNYNMEVRWDGVASLADALRMLRDQVLRTPPPQWVRVMGGWSEFQFAERRLPTLEEVNAISPDTPVFILRYYERALLNRAALNVLGYTKETPNPPRGEIQRDAQGNPTGLLLAQPSMWVLYGAFSAGPRLTYEEQLNSMRQFMRELNRLGITSVIDGGGDHYPDDYQVLHDLATQKALTLRVAYNIFTQRTGHELEDYTHWVTLSQPGDGDAWYRLNGAGEILTLSAFDSANYRQPRPELGATMEAELTQVVRLLVQHRWPFRFHATYNESITRILSVIEAVNREMSLDGLRWILDHAETIAPQNIERVQALGGGIAVQDRIAFQGEDFIARYGWDAAAAAPPIVKMLEIGVPVGAGTDATRVASYNPWVSLSWLVTGKTIGNTILYPPANRLNRLEALHLYTKGSAWFSGEELTKGSLEVGKFADLAVLSSDYFSVPDDEIKRLESVLTIVDGHIVYAADSFAPFAPPPLPISPSWSPTAVFGGDRYARSSVKPVAHAHVPDPLDYNCFPI